MTVIKIISITYLTVMSLAVMGSRVDAATLTPQIESEELNDDTSFFAPSNSVNVVTGERQDPRPYRVYINADSVLPTVSSLAVSNLVGNADSNSDIELSNQPLNQNGHEIPEPSALVGIASIGAIVGLNRIFKKGNKKHK